MKPPARPQVGWASAEEFLCLGIVVLLWKNQRLSKDDHLGSRVVVYSSLSCESGINAPGKTDR